MPGYPMPTPVWHWNRATVQNTRRIYVRSGPFDFVYTKPSQYQGTETNSEIFVHLPEVRLIVIYVFHNLSALALVRGLRQDDELKLVHRTETTYRFQNEEHILRKCFAWYNEGSGETIKSYEGLRSLSTGDVITVLDGEQKASYAIGGIANLGDGALSCTRLPTPVTNNGPFGYYRSPKIQDLREVRSARRNQDRGSKTPGLFNR
jgi:hypothetical protein